MSHDTQMIRRRQTEIEAYKGGQPDWLTGGSRSLAIENNVNIDSLMVFVNIFFFNTYICL